MIRKIVYGFDSSTETLGDALIPKGFRQSIQDYLRKADIHRVPYFSFGLAVYFLIIFAFIIDIFIILTPLFSNTSLLVKILVSLVVIPIIYVLLLLITMFLYRLIVDIKIQMKIGQMEKYLPDFLSALALNLRTGSTIDVALENSVDKDFGVLGEEIKLLVRRMRLGGGVDEAITEFQEKYKSDVINDTFQLILLSWKKGGNTAGLVERIYDNIRSSRFLTEKIIASVTNYRIFLTVLALGIAPAMFSLTYHLIDLIRRISSELTSTPDSAALPFTVNAVRLVDAHFITFSVLSVLLVAICVAFINSIVSSGKAKTAYKNMILYAVGSYAAYQLFLWVFGVFFSLFAV